MKLDLPGTPKLWGGLVAWLVMSGLAAQQEPTPSAISTAVKAFAPHDVDGDGLAEVRQLELLAEHGDAKAALVVIAVEWRLLRAAKSTDAEPLRRSLLRLGQDVAAAGFRSLVVAVEVHAGPPHQDGRTVLGLRRLFQRLHATSPMAGALLVGHFPDALLVRTCNWRRNEPLQLPGKDGKLVAIEAPQTNVRCVPEYVAHRCDVVLADLDGDWERLYVPGPSSLPAVTVVFAEGVPDAGGTARALQTSELQVVDVFHVRDGAAVVDRGAFTVRLDAADRDHECTAADRALGNALAQPDIAISRLDARGVALMPDAEALDVASRAIAVAATGRQAIAWHHDLRLELQLLCDYFDRNHAARTQPLPKDGGRPAAFGHQLGSGFGTMLAADATWQGFTAPGYDVHEQADLVQLAQWLQRSAVLRTLRLHSDPWGGACAASDPDRLVQALGAPWHWRREGDNLVPSWFDHRGGRADFTFYRTLWQRQVLAPNPYLLIHTGCEALSPPGCVEHAYDHPAYGQRAHAESILFFTPCLAMVGRAKVFYDEPRGFCAALGEGKTCGEAWRQYFAIEGAASDWNEVGGDIGRKRAYFWSLLGDFTLRLPRSK